MASKKANDTREQRIKMVSKMLLEDPQIDHAEVNEAVKKKFGVGFDFYQFRSMKYGTAVGSRPGSAAEANSVKTELKKNTTPAPQTDVHKFIRDLGPIAKNMGIEKMSMNMVDGVPKWDVVVTERRQFTV